jgi:hypothetical protein
VIAPEKFVRSGGRNRNPPVLDNSRDGTRLALEANMFFKQFIVLAAFAMGGAALVGEQTTPAAAQEDVSYPWCTQGSALHCYYMNRQQCEETVDYHGFCVTNPDYRAPGGDAGRRGQPQ